MGWTHGWRSNTTVGYPHWNRSFAGGEFKENGLDVSAELTGAVKEAWRSLQHAGGLEKRLEREESSLACA